MFAGLPILEPDVLDICQCYSRRMASCKSKQLQVYNTAAPHLDVQFVNADDIIHYGGAVHCLTRQVPALDDDTAGSVCQCRLHVLVCSSSMKYDYASTLTGRFDRLAAKRTFSSIAVSSSRSTSHRKYDKRNGY